MNEPVQGTKRGRAPLISPAAWRGAWRTGPLAERGFRLLAAGQLTSTVGDYCYAVALPWLVLSAHGGAATLGAVLACYGVPRTVLIPAGGWLADRTGPRTLMLAADVMRCAVVAALTVLALRGLSSVAALGPPAALLGAGEGLFLPASFAIMPTLLPAAQLAAGNAVSTALVQLGSMAGPVLGGAVVAAAGSAPAFAVDAATFAVSALTLALIRPRRHAGAALRADTTGSADAAGPASPSDGGAAGAAAGQDAGADLASSPVPGVWTLLRRERILQVILVMAVMTNLAGAGTFAVALPALAHAAFGAGGYGALIACAGAGTIAGTVGAARGTRLRRPAITACGCLLGFAAATALVPFLGGLPGACAALAVVGATNGCCNIIMITMLQRWAPPRLLGRVMSLVVLAVMGTYPVSAAVTGALIRSTGPRPFFPIAGAAVAAAVVFALAQREVRDFSIRDRPSPARPGGELPAD